MDLTNKDSGPDLAAGHSLQTPVLGGKKDNLVTKPITHTLSSRQARTEV